MSRKPATLPHLAGVPPMVPGKAEGPKTERIFRLAANESAVGPSPKAVEAAQRSAADGHLYPDNAVARLRETIAEKYGLAVDRLICAAGSEKLLTGTARAYAGPGRSLLFTRYSFMVYRMAALITGARPIEAPDRALGADVDSILAAVEDDTILVYLANPNNPTGTWLGIDEIRRLRAGLRPDILLVMDEAYAEYARADDFDTALPMVDEAIAAGVDNVVVMRTFSKFFGLAGLRAGWAYGPEGAIGALRLMEGAFSVSSPAQAAAVAALEDDDHARLARAHNDHWLPRLESELAGLGLGITPSQANFVVAHFGDAEEAAGAVQALFDEGVLILPLEGYGLPASVRITLGDEDANKAVVDGLKRFLAR